MQQVHNDNVLYSWCRARGFVLPRKGSATPTKGEQKEETHLFLNGGRLHVPDEDIDEFFLKMVEAVKYQGAWVYVVEKKTKPSRMFVELDLVLWDRRLTTDEIMSCVVPPFETVMKRAFAVFGPLGPRSIICTAEHAVVGRCEGREQVKNGVHIIWPDVIVDSDKMWTMRAWFLYELSRPGGGMPNIPQEQLCEPWEKVLDPAVFDKNGMRLVWNRKCSVCKVCNGLPYQTWLKERRKGAVVRRQDVAPCASCNTFDNRVDEGRPYDIVGVRCVSDPASELVKLLSDPVLALRSTSIRASPEARKLTSPLVMPPDVAVLINPYVMMRSGGPGGIAAYKIYQKGLKRDDGAPPAKRRCGGDAKLVSVDGSSEEYSVLSQFVADTFSCGTVGVKRDANKHFYIVNTNSHECKNKGGSHGRSTVYFIFHPDGWYQKCWCRKGDVYEPGGVPCSQYRGPLVPYTPEFGAKVSGFFSARQVEKFPNTSMPPVLCVDSKPFAPPEPTPGLSFADKARELMGSFQKWIQEHNKK